MKITIRPIVRSDCAKFEAAFSEQGWHKSEVMFIEYLKQQNTGKRKVFVAEHQGELLGYVTLLPKCESGPFADSEKPIPEIVDFNVLKKYQRNGIGTALMDAAEAEAFKRSDCVCLGVGLHSGYGAAQRMYVKRGYVFDGSGIWYRDEPLPEMATAVNDDDLNLYMLKQLKVLAHKNM